ncbi:hypothetical protein GIS00_14330 [Nakamurella sp. YIM 132087]|uniref:Uncharacterized protein n=1 Tax=Nakamurella alba TaxID=2665158 RepID=A0A7K1FLT4_9ACTN|nr:hypothetical protein [Nakamurella alba]MTD15117.1 hypothetical protein [Nakamurella alba]
MSVDDWVRFFSARAQRLMTTADTLLGEDRLAAACAVYLQVVDSCALALEQPGTPDADRRVLDELAAVAFQAAVPLLPHPAEPVQLGSGAAGITGYYFRPAVDRPGSRTVVFPVDPDRGVEASYRSIAVPVLEAGMACLLVDLGPMESDDPLSRLAPVPHQGALVRHRRVPSRSR